MKYILYILALIIVCHSLSAMEKPPTRKAQEATVDDQVQQIHEKVQSVRLLQTQDINLIAARINAEFYTTGTNYENPSASILEAQQKKAPTFNLEIEDILDKRIKEHTGQMQELLRRFCECQDRLEDLSEQIKKKPTLIDSLAEKGALISAEQAAHEMMKRAAELTYFWSVLHDRYEKGYKQKSIGVVDQRDH